MHFSGRKWHFFKKFILYKNVQWPKIQFFSRSKFFFVISKKVNIFHRIEPIHIPVSPFFTAHAWYQKDFNEMRIIFAFWHFSLFAKMFKNVFSCFQNCQFYYSELSKVVLTAKIRIIETFQFWLWNIFSGATNII